MYRMIWKNNDTSSVSLILASLSFAKVNETKINTQSFVDALQARHDFFESMGCRLSDHGIEEFYAEDYTDAEIKAIFDKVYGGKELTNEEIFLRQCRQRFIQCIFRQKHAANNNSFSVLVIR